MLRKYVKRIISKASSEEAYSFIISSLKSIYDNISFDTLKDSIIDDDRDGGIDVIHSEGKILSLFDIKGGGRGFSYKEIEAFRNDIDKFLFNPQQSLKGLSPAATKRIQFARERQ